MPAEGRAKSVLNVSVKHWLFLGSSCIYLIAVSHFVCEFGITSGELLKITEWIAHRRRLRNLGPEAQANLL